MAAFLFTRAIELGKPLTLYNKGEMRRDFTCTPTTSPAASSVDAVLRRRAAFNLGNNQPVELMHFIQTIEKSLGTKATMKHKTSTAEIMARRRHQGPGASAATRHVHRGRHGQVHRLVPERARRHAFAGGHFNDRRRHP
ncbi:racemase/epimerase [Aureococcus anophagefferens]|nr:racemase/epimerase [Aureococcus anophagefferens]